MPQAESYEVHVELHVRVGRRYSQPNEPTISSFTVTGKGFGDDDGGVVEAVASAISVVRQRADRMTQAVQQNEDRRRGL